MFLESLAGGSFRGSIGDLPSQETILTGSSFPSDIFAAVV